MNFVKFYDFIHRDVLSGSFKEEKMLTKKNKKLFLTIIANNHM